MRTTHLIAARVSPETKARFRSLAEQQQMTESALLKRLVDLAVRGAGEAEADVLKSPARRLRGARLCVRLHPDDQLLLSERAAARQMAAATYVSVLVRAHLRTLSPLPRAELTELKRQSPNSARSAETSTSWLVSPTSGQAPPGRVNGTCSCCSRYVKRRGTTSRA
jgi:hypothetical protein